MVRRGLRILEDIDRFERYIYITPELIAELKKNIGDINTLKRALAKNTRGEFLIGIFGMYSPLVIALSKKIIDEYGTGVLRTNRFGAVVKSATVAKDQLFRYTAEQIILKKLQIALEQFGEEELYEKIKKERRTNWRRNSRA